MRFAVAIIVALAVFAAAEPVPSTLAARQDVPCCTVAAIRAAADFLEACQAGLGTDACFAATRAVAGLGGGQCRCAGSIILTDACFTSTPACPPDE